MRFLIFIYGDKKYKQFFLPIFPDEKTCKVILPKDDFSLPETIQLKFKRRKDYWYIQKNVHYEIRGNQFFQLERNNDSNGYKLNFERKYEIVIGRQRIHLKITCRKNCWKKYHKYKLTSCRFIKEEDGIKVISDNEKKKEGIQVFNKDGQWIVKNEKGIDLYVNENLMKKSQHLLYGDVLCIDEISMIFLGNYIAIEKNEKIEVSLIRCDIRDMIHSEIEKIREVNDNEVFLEKNLFHRSLRVMEEIEEKKVEIEAPPSIKEKENRSLFMEAGPVINMMIPMFCMNLFLLYGMKEEQERTSIYAYSAVVMTVISMISSIVWILISRKYENKQAEERIQRTQKAYQKYLEKKNNVIKQQYNRTRRILQSRYIQVSEYLDSPVWQIHLWNRNPYHIDFLIYRVGIGNIPFQMKIQIPEEVFQEKSERLWEELKRIKKHYHILYKVPVLLDVQKYNQIGIIGEWNETFIGMLRNIILQIAFANCYTEVKMGFIYNKERIIQSKQWDFCRWLPHTWDKNKQNRYIAENKEQARELFYDLFQIFKMRELSGRKKGEQILPYYILFIEEERYLEGEMFSKYIFNQEEKLGLTVIWIASDREKLPNICRLVIENSIEFSGYYEIESHSQNREQINFDYISRELSDKFSRDISGIRIAEIEEQADIPERIDFLSMYGVEQINELNIEERWETNRIQKSARVLIGKMAGEQLCYLDVHERYHGPHGLLAGTTGSGKSEVLQTLILSMAINFSPQAVNFLLIDYKGEGMSGLFSELPHVSGSISNLSEGQVQRAMVSIKSENRRRQRLFKKYKVNNINDYIELFDEGEIIEEIPHLMIIIDEFAELKKEHPEFMKELISVAQVGRSLGVHLILATQKPGGIVDDKIWSNSRFRICLKVQEREDSMDMLHNMDACEITKPGRGYLQVGNNEVYELFQTGWSGAALEENEKKDRVQLIFPNGQVHKYAETKKEKKHDKAITQLQAIKIYVTELARVNGYDKGRKLWMQPLPRQIYLSQIKKLVVSNTTGQEDKNEVWVCVGQFDDPENQEQPAFSLNLMESGHIAVCGRSMSGKSVFWQTFVFSLLVDNQGKEIKLYILDYDGGAMDIYKSVGEIEVFQEDEEEKIDQLFMEVATCLKERRKQLKGGTFVEYRQNKREKDNPLIIIIIDGFIRFSEITQQRYEESLYSILCEGEKLGMLLNISVESFSSMCMPMRLAEFFKTKICFYMKDSYMYGEALDTMQVPVFPEKGIPGRGIAYYGKKILLFQTALAVKADNDYKRQEKIMHLLEKRY